jgi:hypothetical protein
MKYKAIGIKAINLAKKFLWVSTAMLFSGLGILFGMGANLSMAIGKGEVDFKSEDFIPYLLKSPWETLQSVINYVLPRHVDDEETLEDKFAQSAPRVVDITTAERDAIKEVTREQSGETDTEDQSEEPNNSSKSRME